jgi:hypothetical protein
MSIMLTPHFPARRVLLSMHVHSAHTEVVDYNKQDNSKYWALSTNSSNLYEGISSYWNHQGARQDQQLCQIHARNFIVCYAILTQAPRGWYTTVRNFVSNSTFTFCVYNTGS